MVLSSLRRWNCSSRGRLTLLVCACVLPLWLMGVAAIYMSYLEQVDMTRQRLVETARALSLAVDRELGISEAALKTLATSPYLAAATEDLEAFQRQALEVRHQQRLNSR